MLGLGQISFQRLGDWETPTRRTLGPRAVIKRRTTAEQRRLEHILIGQGESNRAPHVNVVEGRHLVVERNESNRIVLRGGNHLELALAFQRRGIARLQVDDNIRIAALDQIGPCRGLRHSLGDQTLEVRLALAPAVPSVIAPEDDLLARLVGFYRVGPAASGVVFQPGLRPWIFCGGVGLGQLRVDDNGIDCRQVG